MRTSSRSVVAILVLSSAALAVISAQQPQAPERFRSATTLVPVDVRVLDRSGKPITDLTQSDFTVTENGIRQTISTFSASAMTPASPAVPLLRAVGRSESLEPQSARVFLLLMGRGRIEGPSKGVAAMEDFVRDRLLPQDRVAVMAWNRTTELSTDRNAILAVLEAFRKQHEKIERDLTEWFRGLRGQVGSREMPPHIQTEIDAVFASSTLHTRTRVDDPNDFSGLTAELKRTQGALERADAAGDRPAGSSLSDGLDASLLMGAEGSLDQFINRNITLAQDLANLRAAIDYLHYLDGEKHVIFVTETGLPSANITGNGTIAAAANSARVVVDTIQSGGVSGDGLVSAANGPVLNAATGGATAPSAPAITFNAGFATKNINVLARDTGGVSTVYRSGADAVKRIDDATRFGYLLGYYSTDHAYDNRYRNVVVTVNRPGAEVLYRHGYYATAAPVALNTKEMAGYSRMSRAATSDADVLDLPLSFTARTEGLGPTAAVTIDLNVRIDTLAPVETPQGRQYSLQLAVFCANGKKIVGQLSKRLDVTLNPALYEKMRAGGLTATVSVPISAPATVVKVIVLDTATDSLGSVMKAIK